MTVSLAELKKVFRMSWEQLASADGKSAEDKAKKEDNSWETDGCFTGPGEEDGDGRGGDSVSFHCLLPARRGQGMHYCPERPLPRNQLDRGVKKVETPHRSDPNPDAIARGTGHKESKVLNRVLCSICSSSISFSSHPSSCSRTELRSLLSSPGT